MKTKTNAKSPSRSWPLVLGLDVSQDHLKYLFLQKKGKKSRIEAFGKYPFEKKEGEDPSIGASRVVGSFLRENKSLLAKAKKVLGVESGNLVIKSDHFPALSKKELEQAVFFYVQKELGKEAEGSPFVFDYFPLSASKNGKGETELMTLGVSEETVDERIRYFSDHKMIPTKIVPTVLAMGNLIRSLSPADKGDLIGLLDIGAQKSTLVFFKNGQLEFHREIPIGGDDFTKAITGIIFHEGKAIQFDQDEAAEFKMRYGYPLGFSEGMTFRGAAIVEVGAMMRPAVERLIGEIQRSMGFYSEKSGGKNIGRLHLVGGGARLKHLNEVLAEKLQIPVSLLPVPAGLAVAGKKGNRDLFERRFLEQAITLSLSMESGPRGNLMPLRYKAIQKRDQVQKNLLCTAIAMVGLLFIVSSVFQNRIRTQKQQIVRMEKKLLKSKGNEQTFAALMTQKGLLENQLSRLKGKTEQDQTVVQMLRLVSQVIPDHLSLVTLSYSQEKSTSKKEDKVGKDKNSPQADAWVLSMQGISRKPPNDVGIYLAQFIMDLEKSGYFSEVKLEKDLYDPKQNEYGFELICTMKNAGGEIP